MRLPVGNIVRRDHDLRDRDACELKPCGRQMARSGGNNTPAAIGNRADKIHSPWHYCDSIVVRGFAVFEFSHLHLRIKMRSDSPNYLESTHTMSNGQHFFFVDSPLAGPDAPLPAHRTGGIDENSVKIEENGGTPKNGHSLFFITASGQRVGSGRTGAACGVEAACRFNWRSCKWRCRKWAFARSPQARTNQ